MIVVFRKALRHRITKRFKSGEKLLSLYITPNHITRHNETATAVVVIDQDIDMQLHINASAGSEEDESKVNVCMLYPIYE